MEHRFADTPFGSVSQTNIHIIAIAILLIGCFLFFKKNGEDRLSILIIITILLPLHQKIIIANMHFSITRILIMVCLIRTFLSQRRMSWRVTSFDKLIFAWAISRALTYGLLWENYTALVSRIGMGLDFVGIYICTRILINQWEDYDELFKKISFVCIALAIAMLFERFARINLFDLALENTGDLLYRGDTVRCRGPFGHAILAGTFGAVTFPILAGLCYSFRNKRSVYFIGCAACLTITYLSGSSGPVIACGIGLIIICMWPARELRNKLLFAMLAGLFILNVITDEPLWTQVVRAKIYGESAAWHRGLLFSEFINRVGEWWLIGVRYTDHWGHFSFDVSNWIVRSGVDGGVFTLGLFIAVIKNSYSKLSFILKFDNTDRIKSYYSWCLIAALFVHFISFFGVSYWDQSLMIWSVFLGLVSWVSESGSYKNIKNMATI